MSQSGITLDNFRAGKDNPRSSAWSVKGMRSFTLFSPGATPGIFQGIVTHTAKDLEPAGYATDLDVIVDLSQSSIAMGLAGAVDASVYIALWSQVLTQRKYRAQYALNPTTGFLVSVYPSGMLQAGDDGNCIQDGNRFLVQMREVGLVWGFDMAAAGSVPNFAVTGVNVSSICHGIERGSV